MEIGLGKVETFQTYLDIAFKNGVSSATRARSETIRDRLKKSKHIEGMRIAAVAKTLCSTIDAIIQGFPRTEELAPFYQELMKCTLDYGLMKQSFGALIWAKKRIQILLDKTKRDLFSTRKVTEINKIRQSFSGRISSVMRQVKDNFLYLEECRKVIRGYPSLKTKVNTIVIAGAPNVGKSTLLAVLTGSKPKTAHYPFTTKKLNLGYDSKRNQYIDTPGLLDRPLAQRNPIEKQAILALKHLATIVVFVVDPTETCGYSLPEQRNLLIEIKKMFKHVIVVSNKADTGAKFKNSIEISALKGTGIPALRKEIASLLDKKSK